MKSKKTRGDEEIFSGGTCARRVLAGMYFPEAEASVAVRRLKRWMDRCQPLQEELAAVDYRPHRHWFSAREVALILAYLGEP